MRTHEELVATCGELCFNSSTANYSICTEDYFVDCHMYPKRIKDLKYLVPVTVALLFIFVTGLLGNLCVCVVIRKHPKMLTETNVYLFSLAVSDILLLMFGLAPELWYYWQMYPYVFGEFTCRLSRFLASTGTWASTMTVVAFSIERYIAICYHTKFRSRSKKRVRMALCAIWTISVALSVPVLLAYRVVPQLPVEYPPDAGLKVYSSLSTKCAVPDTSYASYDGYVYMATGVLFFFIPMVILTLMYIKIGLYIRKNRQLARKSGIHNSCTENSKVIKLLVAVVAVFFISGAPLHYQRITTKPTEGSKEHDRTVLVLTALGYYSSAAINPVLYNIWCKRNRKAFMEIINVGTKKENTYVPMNTVAKNINGSKKSTTTTTGNVYTTQSSL